MLHGPFSALLESADPSIALDRFWTAFTYEYESNYLAHSRPLSVSLGPVNASSLSPSNFQKVQEALRQFSASSLSSTTRSETSADDIDRIGIVTRHGHVSEPKASRDADQALERHLVKLLHASLPPVRTVNVESEQGETLKPGLWSGGTRKTSWANNLGLGWIPGISSTSTSTPTPRSPVPGDRSRPSSSASYRHQLTRDATTTGKSALGLDNKATHEPSSTASIAGRDSAPQASSPGTLRKTSDNWGMNFGLGGLTDAMGNIKVAPALDMGNLFRFGSPSKSPAMPGSGTVPTENSIDANSMSDSAQPSSFPPTQSSAPTGAASAEAVANRRNAAQPDLERGESAFKSATPADGSSILVDTATNGILPLRSSLEVEIRPGLLPDLQEAVSSDEVGLGWSTRIVYLSSSVQRDAPAHPRAATSAGALNDDARDRPEGIISLDNHGDDDDHDDNRHKSSSRTADTDHHDDQIQPRTTPDSELKPTRLSWIIRDDILLYLLSYALDPVPSIDSTSVLSLFQTLSQSLSPQQTQRIRPKSSSSDLVDPTTWVMDRSEGLSKSGEMSSTAQSTMLELKDWMEADPTIEEVYAKTAQDFLVVKDFQDHGDKREGDASRTYLSVGRKESSLTDAECKFSHSQLGLEV